jgi:hypothetical protein
MIGHPDELPDRDSGDTGSVGPLTAATDRLNNLIDRVETMLRVESEGCTARIEIEGGALAFERTLWWYPTDGTRCPLRSAPRHVRVIASCHIGHLRQQMTKERESTRDHVRTAIGVLESILSEEDQ